MAKMRMISQEETKQTADKWMMILSLDAEPRSTLELNAVSSEINWTERNWWFSLLT